MSGWWIGIWIINSELEEEAIQASTRRRLRMLAYWHTRHPWQCWTTKATDHGSADGEARANPPNPRRHWHPRPYRTPCRVGPRQLPARTMRSPTSPPPCCKHRWQRMVPVPKTEERLVQTMVRTRNLILTQFTTMTTIIHMHIRTKYLYDMFHLVWRTFKWKR
jgi:hypothetical protein